MERSGTTNAEQASNAPGTWSKSVDWGYLFAHAVMFPPLFMAGVVSRLTPSARAQVSDEGTRARSIFRVAAEDARDAISTAMTDM